MANSVTLTITSDKTAGDLSDVFVSTNNRLAVQRMQDYLSGVVGGAYSATIAVDVNTGDATTASGQVVVSGPIAGDSLLINGVALVAGSDFAIGGSDTITATNLAAAINASSDPLIDGLVTASSSSSTVTISAASVGTSGNLITLEGRGTHSLDPNGSGTAASGTLTCASVAAADTAVINGVTLTAVDKREKTQVTAVADTGAVEITDITAVADASAYEVSDVTTVADTGAFETVTVVVPATAAATQADYIVLTGTTGTKTALWLDIDAAGTPPTGAAYLAADNQIMVSIVTGNTAVQNAAALQAAAASTVGYTAVDNLDGTVTYTQTLMGNATNAARHDAGDVGNGSFSFTGEVNGAASNLNSKYFTFTLKKNATNYYAWYNVNSEGVDPAPGGTGIAIALSAGATANTVASSSRSAITTAAGVNATISGATDHIIITNTKHGTVTDTADGAAATGFTFLTTTQGVNSNLNSSYFTYQTRNSGGASTNDRYVWYSVDGDGVDPAPGGTGIQVSLSPADSANTVASLTRTALAADTKVAITGATDHIIITNAFMGTATDTADGGAATGFTFTKTADGAASNLNSKYFTFKSAADATSYYMWYNVNGEGTDPAPGGTGVSVAIAAGDVANTVASASRAKFALSPLNADFTESGATDKILFQCVSTGATTDSADGAAATGFAFSTTIQGGSVGATEFQIGSNSVTATNLKTAINAQASLTPIVIATVSSNVVTVKAIKEGIEGNDITIAGTGNVSASGARLSGGADSGLVRLSGGANSTSATTYSFGR